MTTKKSKAQKIDWEKVVVYGLALGYMASSLYLMLVIAAGVTA